MKRKLITKLLEWKESNTKKPLLLLGALGVGKTFLAYDFAKTFFTESIYINIEREPDFFSLVNEGSDKMDDVLKEHYHVTDDSGDVLIILDEVHSCPNIKLILNELSNSKFSLSILILSSIWDETIYSCDYFKKLFLYPLDFEEFLVAVGKEWYIEVITFHYNSNKKIPDIVHQELLALFELYLQIGGMPQAVNEYINMESTINVPEQHKILTYSYLTHVNKSNSDSNALKINQVFDVLDKQLMKENKKFQYTLIRKGATGAMYSDALHYINNSFYGIRCKKLEDNLIHQYNLKNDESNNESAIENHFSYEDDNKAIFKQYILDIGMLNSSMKTQNDHTSDNARKGLLENYIALCLLAKGYPLYFWESSSQAKIDFIISKDNHLIPIEIKINENTRSKNISVFKTKYETVEDAIKISTKNFEYSKNIKYVPIYASFCI